MMIQNIGRGYFGKWNVRRAYLIKSVKFLRENLDQTDTSQASIFQIMRNFIKW